MCGRQSCKALFLVIFLVVTVRGRVIPDDELQFGSIDFHTCPDMNASRSQVECQETREASGYSLSINATEFKPKEIIDVKVYRTRCPTPGQVSPTKWYQLELYFDNNEIDGTMSLGHIEPTFYRTDIYSCTNGSKILFYPCESNPYDFPGRFAWTAPSNADSLVNSSICFRLTVSQEDSSTCETVTRCISAGEVEQEMIPGGLGVGNGEDDFADYVDETEDDGLLKNLTDILNEETELILQRPPNCKENQQFYQQLGAGWLPHCDCNGYYHPVQCFSQPDTQITTCWCSTKYGSEVSGTRVSVECTDISVSTFELSCFTGHTKDM